MVIYSSIQLLGRTGSAGCYILLIELLTDLQVRFGRFDRGRPIFLPKGDYLYIGSAKGEIGASSLGYRLLRHAARSGGKPPHAIRDKLHVSLQNAGMPVKVPAEKRLHWHIDHLLDLPGAEIRGAIIIRSQRVNERILAERLAILPNTSIPAAGLGASDHPGGTHLLRVELSANWWQNLPALISRLINLDDGNPKI